jgi:hypothetical protein
MTHISEDTRNAYASHAAGYTPPERTEPFPLTSDEARRYDDPEVKRIVTAASDLLARYDDAFSSNDYELMVQVTEAVHLLFDVARRRVVHNFLAANAEAI